MRVHSDQTIEKIKTLRKKGYSINALVQEFSIPKTTIWHHIHDIKLPEKYIRDLRSNQGGSRKRKELALLKANEEALQILSSPDRYCAGLLSMLYWAEGHQNNGLTFTNTNPEMVRLFIELLEKCFGIKKDRLLITIRYFTGMDRNKCLTHWSKVTGIPKKLIKMYYNDSQTRGRSPFGMCRLTVKKGSYSHKIVKALIKNITQELMPLSFNG